MKQLIGFLLLFSSSMALAQDRVVHDAEYYILEAQNGQRWSSEDQNLARRLAELKAKHGTPPNLIHIMWDDTAFGDVGIPAIQKVRGLNTPNLNTMARNGILFTRMYTEVGCTPSRAACITGRYAVRCGMYNIGMLRESHGMRGEEETLAEVLSKVGYATAFHGKWHLGDIEVSYPHKQGFDEAFFTGYNQILSLNTKLAEGANASIGLFEDMLPKDPYKLDDTFITKGWVQIAEGTKNGPTRQWGDNSHENYMKIDPEAQRRTLDFIERNAKAGKPFYVANWPNLTSFIPNPKKYSQARSILQDGLESNIDPFVGKIIAKLKELGIEENTLLVCMADNGPMSHNPPPGLGMEETIFRGGKGDFTEGGVRVPAQAYWPGTIKPGQIVGDIIHETDLYTTFASLAGAKKYIPTDRVVDGVDQTSLLLNGDTFSRRDSVFIYAGPQLGATVKGNYKRHWISSDSVGESSGIPAAFYFLPADPREKSPMLVNLIHLKSPFNRMRLRHELWKKKYPDSKELHGVPWTGIENATPEVKALSRPPANLKNLPFDPLEYLEHLDKLPFDPKADAGLGG
ncbi:MAG: sulfatase-like hydrolase/transferase [Planctomycetes bacterium]|nr:sulfatase-like hydrolase/transferase [Planctomycetota bacterium]MCH9726204.1 sulfatase-like hydrolase/transferase [Planctomycetota bacterium]MCH9775709.1 sulfatase-like hydrolase/transferase [Planctomycetota bacterium]MCH9792352.1 sulfatase-like hydrolase/transferase [Planctomycetota bacterium]